MAKKMQQSPETILDAFKAHFGNTVKSYWMYEGEMCPGCGQELDMLEYEGEPTLSINGFMYRAKGVLIAYPLCSECASVVMAATPMVPTPRHQTIERNLINAYHRYLDSLDA